MKKITLYALAILLLTAVICGCANDDVKKARHLSRADAYVAQKDYKAAVIELKNAIQIDPKDADLPYRLGEVYMKMNEGKLAARAYGDAIDLDPDHLRAHLKIGQIFLATRNLLAARKAAKFIIEKEPSNVEAYLLLAGVQVLEKNREAAVNTLNEALAIAPRNTKCHLFIADLLKSDGRHQEAEKHYLEVIAIDPADPTSYVELMTIYGQNGMWQQAEKVLDTMGPTTAKQYQSLSMLARYCERSGNLKLAEKIFLKGAAAASPQEVGPLRELGLFYARGHRFDMAIETMQRAIEMKPDEMGILTDIGRLYLDMGDLDAAETRVDKVLAQDDQNEAATFLKGEIEYSRGRYDQAIHYLDLATTRAPSNFKAYYYKALCILRRGAGGMPEVDLFRAAAGFQDDAEQWVAKLAEDNLLKALELNPKLLPAKLTLAQVYLRQQRTEKARKLIQSALDQAPGDLSVLTLQGSLLILEGQFLLAEKICLDVLARHPDLSAWHTRLGVVYKSMNRFDAAVAAFRKALDLNPKQFEALTMMVDIFLEKKDYPDAMAACETQMTAVADSKPAQAFIQYMEGRVSTAMGAFDRARDSFEKAIAIDPNYIMPRMNLAAIAIRGQRTDEAVSIYQSVLAINPDFLPACMALGSLYYQQKEMKLAEKFFSRALSIKVGYVPAANNLAYLLSAYDSRIREALDLALMARLKQPENASVRDTLGWIYYRTAQYPQAIEELEASLKIDPRNPLACYHLGLAYYQVKRFGESRKLLGQALELDPQFENARDIRLLLDQEQPDS